MTPVSKTPTLQDFVPDKLPPIRRPNGKLYRPRKITTEFFVDQDQIEEGVVVFGTHDFAVARYRAFRLAASIGMMAVDPERRWMKMVIRRYDPMFEDYPETGRACVWFKGLVELSPLKTAGEYSPTYTGKHDHLTREEAEAITGIRYPAPPPPLYGPGAFANYVPIDSQSITTTGV